MLMLELLVNGFVVVLLVATLIYCRILNSRIRVLQDGKSELARLLKHFDESTSRASESIVSLQTASRKIAEGIRERVEKAEYLARELDFLIERAGKLSDTLEAEINIGRSVGKVNRSDAGRGKPVPARAPNVEERQVLREAVQEVMHNEAKNMHTEAAKRRNAGGMEKLSGPAKESGISSLQTMLEKLANRASAGKQEPPRPSPAARQGDERTRSRAEQELLEIIRAGKV